MMKKNLKLDYEEKKWKRNEQIKNETSLYLLLKKWEVYTETWDDS